MKCELRFFLRLLSKCHRRIREPVNKKQYVIRLAPGDSEYRYDVTVGIPDIISELTILFTGYPMDPKTLKTYKYIILII